MKITVAIAVTLILAGCAEKDPPAGRAVLSDSASVPPARSEAIQGSEYTQLLTLWRSYRTSRSEISDVEDYARGFLKGYAGPPGLVDGSPDFNLGHSDGMQANMGVYPHGPDAASGQ